jgi:hypothetical protein
VTGGKGNGFIEKEKLCVAVGLHDGSLTVLEGQYTADPRFVPPTGSAESLLTIVQNTAISHEPAAH